MVAKLAMHYRQHDSPPRTIAIQPAWIAGFDDRLRRTGDVLAPLAIVEMARRNCSTVSRCGTACDPNWSPWVGRLFQHALEADQPWDRPAVDPFHRNPTHRGRIPLVSNLKWKSEPVKRSLGTAVDISGGTNADNADGYPTVVDAVCGQGKCQATHLTEIQVDDLPHGPRPIPRQSS